MKYDDIKEYSLPFAAWELRLYLNTHPDDAEAYAKYKALCASMGDKCNYACHTEQRRPMTRENDCGCEVNTRNTARDSGCGCEHNVNFTNGQNYGGGNYGGRRNDSGNFDGNTRRDTVCDCGCGCDGTDNSNRQNVWSWIDGPWPWEPEANITGGKC